MTTRPRVYIVNQPQIVPGRPTYDVSPAMQYGDVLFVFTDADTRPSDDAQAAIDHAYDMMQDAQEGDFVVWAGGDPFSMVIVANVINDLTGGKFNYLRWERQRVDGQRTGGGYYLPVAVDLTEPE